MTEQTFDPDRLRPAEYACEPDPRSAMFARIDWTNGTSRPIELADHHEEISGYVLHAGVPEEILEQFETARNLYLYSWFVYRFYPVAEHHSLACLELALRKRLEEEIRTGKIKKKKPTLHTLLKYAVEHGFVKNEGFSAWWSRGENRSQSRVEMEKMLEASEKNLDEITWDDSDRKVTEEDLNWDYVNILADALPALRNVHAHGSTNLHNGAVRIIQIVCEIINQLYEPPREALVAP